MIDEDFIRRAKKLVEPLIEESIRNEYNNKWTKKNPKKHAQCMRRYENTEKGAYAVSKRNYKRRQKMYELTNELSWKEKELIGKFYKNCPEGYEVDHIHPVSKGGKHCLSNLQYLTREDNRNKSAKLDWKKD